MGVNDAVSSKGHFPILGFAKTKVSLILTTQRQLPSIGISAYQNMEVFNMVGLHHVHTFTYSSTRAFRFRLGRHCSIPCYTCISMFIT